MTDEEDWAARRAAGLPTEVLYFNGSGSPHQPIGSFIDEGQLAELCAWVASLGADPTAVLPQFRILAWEGRYQLHLSVKVRRNGRDVLDQALDKVWSEPLVIDLGRERCWPKWLHDTREVADG